MKSLGLICVLSLALAQVTFGEAASEGAKSPQPPPPLVPGAKVVPLWPAGSPTLKNFDEQEAVTYAKGSTTSIVRVTNINNPSIELHL
ncbi:MAG TPA: hypothetical protein VG754_11370, partial [Verrucomicrobiae bacterium]|nr:hypothetical protein [Verrucomicrobiae bacterium]